MHVRQVRALGWVRFYSSYFWQWLKVFVRTWNYGAAYYSVSYEQQAYDTSSAIVMTVTEKAEFGVA